MSIPISVTEAKQDKLFYVVANVVIVNAEDKTCLLLKRGDQEKVLPGKWAFPGGKLEHQDVQKLLQESGAQAIDGIPDILEKLAAREAEEECGLKIDGSAKVITNKVFVRPDGVPVFMITLASQYAGGEVRLEADAFSDFAWVSEAELADYDCIDSVVGEAKKALSRY